MGKCSLVLHMITHFLLVYHLPFFIVNVLNFLFLACFHFVLPWVICCQQFVNGIFQIT
uniref:Uncharacterized protein n=1 Tax=Mandrillus leucophaeus TaxID=9568 RepID=A0A2K5XVI7_MANLE